MKSAILKRNARVTYKSRNIKIDENSGRNNSKFELSKKDLIYYNYNKLEYKSIKYK
jgi:hypothetical protein